MVAPRRPPGLGPRPRLRLRDHPALQTLGRALAVLLAGAGGGAAVELIGARWVAAGLGRGPGWPCCCAGGRSARAPYCSDRRR